MALVVSLFEKSAEHVKSPIDAYYKERSDLADKYAVADISKHNLTEDHITFMLHQYTIASSWQARAIAILLDRKALTDDNDQLNGHCKDESQVLFHDSSHKKGPF